MEEPLAEETGLDWFTIIIVLLYLLPILYSKGAARRVFFILISAVAMVVFSEKIYWYTSGYNELIVVGLSAGYYICVFTCLHTLQVFRVHTASGLFLCACLYAIVTEGAITPIMYAGGVFGIDLPGYFFGWHALISVMFGWYALRKWLVQGQVKCLTAACAAMGVLWACWNTVLWFPFDEEQEVGIVKSVQWFALYTFVVTACLAVAHLLLDRVLWIREYKPKRTERIVAYGIAAFWFAAIPLLSTIMAEGWLRSLAIPAKLILLIIFCIFPLWLDSAREKRKQPLDKTSPNLNPRIPLAVFMLAALCFSYGPLFYADEDAGAGALLWATVKFAFVPAMFYCVARFRHRLSHDKPPILEQLSGRCKTPHLLALFAMPIAASLTYALLVAIQPPERFVYLAFYRGIVLIQVYLGLALWVASMAVCYWRWRETHTQADTIT